MNLLHRLRDWLVGPKGWLIADATPAEQNDLSQLDRLDGQHDVAWVEKASTQNPNHRPEDIHIIHNGETGWNYWYTNNRGYLNAGIGYRTEGKAWRAALLDQEHEANAHDDYPN